MQRTTFTLLFLACGVASASAQTTVRYVSAIANDLVFSAQTRDLYYSSPSAAGATYGNSIVRIDPTLATITGSMFAGSEPTELALSQNGVDLYSGFSGASIYRRFDVSTMSGGASYNLGSSGFLGPMFVDDIQVSPDSPNTVAISRRNQGFSPRSEGLAIYDNGVARPTQVAPYPENNIIQYGVTGSRLYGYNNEDSGFQYRTLSVDANGVTIQNSYASAIQGYNASFVYSDGRSFATTGRTLDAETGNVIGTFGASGPVAADSISRRVFFLTGSGSSTAIAVFNMDTYLPITTIAVSQAVGQGDSLIRYGSNGLAFRTDTQVVLIQSSAVPEPATFAVLGLGMVALLQRRRILPAK